jgi:hypothetical protein
MPEDITNKCISFLAGWISTQQAHCKSPERQTHTWYLRRNERYLHHWFSGKYQCSDFLEQDQFHPEWPSHKKDHQITDHLYLKNKNNNDSDPKEGQEEEDILLNQKELITRVNQFTRMPSAGINKRGYPTFIDFALGNYNNPDTLIEFKWNNIYQEWAFDFYKLCDRRLRGKERIFLGVRSTQKECNATTLLNNYLNAVIDRLNQEETVQPIWRNESFYTMLIDVHFIGNPPCLKVRACVVKAEKEGNVIVASNWSSPGSDEKGAIEDFLKRLWDSLNQAK